MTPAKNAALWTDDEVLSAAWFCAGAAGVFAGTMTLLGASPWAAIVGGGVAMIRAALRLRRGSP